jgi:hypothetical protein
MGKASFSCKKNEKTGSVYVVNENVSRKGEYENSNCFAPAILLQSTLYSLFHARFSNGTNIPLQPTPMH